mmetsp:Transcript_92937/g.248720  ORF Transcript_92937/g.248720 Transcript_92937/m.248720 type:complete len:352 (+) Transcript_92937:2310-3365(+)
MVLEHQGSQGLQGTHGHELEDALKSHGRGDNLQHTEGPIIVLILIKLHQPSGTLKRELQHLVQKQVSADIRNGKARLGLANVDHSLSECIDTIKLGLDVCSVSPGALRNLLILQPLARPSSCLLRGARTKLAVVLVGLGGVQLAEGPPGRGVAPGHHPIATQEVHVQLGSQGGYLLREEVHSLAKCMNELVPEQVRIQGEQESQHLLRVGLGQADDPHPAAVAHQLVDHRFPQCQLPGRVAPHRVRTVQASVGTSKLVVRPLHFQVRNVVLVPRCEATLHIQHVELVPPIFFHHIHHHLRRPGVRRAQPQVVGIQLLVRQRRRRRAVPDHHHLRRATERGGIHSHGRPPAA